MSFNLYLLSFSPLEQFQISPIFSCTCFKFNFSFSNFTLFLIFSFFLLFLFFRLVIFKIKIFPQNFQLICEGLYFLVGNMLKDNLGKKGEVFLPVFFVLFLIVLICNLLGMIPYSFTITSHLFFTFFLAFIIFFGITYIGIYSHKLNFLNIFLPKNTPVFIIPLLVVIELISYIIKIFTLSIRLFANITSGHALLKIIAGFTWVMISVSGYLSLIGLIPILLLFLLISLELGIAFLQAYVFTLLSCIYLNDVLETH
uniref:ATP synthase F0 subunit 6 n=1 Tax=Neorhodella cyanea TaxID=131155 RepID=UPI001FCCD57D|nr:ATP synthase F0 subunit 6 [Neorhodella cyanea]UNJ18802.1 ATP synthase F0 subunit 6 [Neorhodella cyanea]